VVASDLLGRQMGWEDGADLLSAPAADPAAFADRIVTLYRDAALWQRLRDAALARLATENGPERMVAALRTLLG
jgi:glycosyltransferase involved in cell wall biosynthesis